jgi:hypothetical protein
MLRLKYYLLKKVIPLITKMTNKMQLCRIIYYSLTALHVSTDILAHHQEHLNCIYSTWYYSVVDWCYGWVGTISNPFMTPTGSDIRE